MRKKTLILLFIGITFSYSCSTSNSNKAKKISEGVYRQSGWIFDLKKKDGKDILPYYTVTKLSDNTIASNGSNVQTGLKLSFKIDKKEKEQIVGVYFETTIKSENEFKFPRCLSVCPVNIEFENEKGITRLKSFYNRNNAFHMQMVDKVINDLVLFRQKIRVRIPISISNQNTTFEWFDFDLSNYTTKLNL